MKAFEMMTEETMTALGKAQFDLDMDRVAEILAAEGLTVADWDAWCAEEDAKGTEEDDGWYWEDPWDE